MYLRTKFQVSSIILTSFRRGVIYPPPSQNEPPKKLTQIWVKKWGLTGSQFLDWGCWEKGGELFQGGLQCSFYIKSKPKSEVFNDKKSL